MALEFKELLDWHFDVDEISANVYKVIGIDRQGRNVEATGSDPDVLIEKCRQSAIQMMQDKHDKI